MGMDKAIEKKKGLRIKHIFYFLGGMLFLALILKIIFTSGTSTFKVEKNKLTIEEVEYGQFNDYIRVAGKVEPISTIYLDAEEDGRVKERLIEEGVMVKKGDVILKLENSMLYENIMNSEANLAQKQNMLRQTRINFQTQRIESKRRLLDSHFDILKKRRSYEQQKALYTDELVSKEDYLQAKEDYEYTIEMQKINQLKAQQDSLIRVTEMKQLGNDLKKMQKTLGLVYKRLDNLNVKAPVDGQLGMLDAEIGQSIARGQRIGQINVLTNYKIEAQIDEHYIDRVKRDLEATFERQDNTFGLTVKKVYPEVREGQFKIDLIFTGERPDNIRTGQTYYINLQLGQPQKSLLIPRGGFFQNTGGQWVYVLDESGNTATKRSIQIGRQNPKYYEVIEGLQEGEKVITSSYDLFGDSDRLIMR